MATRKEIFDKELVRQERDQWTTVHFFQEGMFWHAYEWSAWLVVSHLRSDLKVIHKPSKDGDFVMVGFPVEGLDRAVPTDSPFVKVDDKQIDVQLSDTVFPPDVTYETLREAFVKWKEGYPLQVRRKPEPIARAVVSAHPEYGPPTVFGVVQEILTYPIESRSMKECMDFLIEIRQKLTSLL